MTAKRFELMSNDEVIIDNCSIADDGGKQTYWIVEYGQRIKVVELLNKLYEEKEQLKAQLKNIEDDFEISYTEKPGHFDKDKLYVKDTHTKIHLNNRNLFIEVYIPHVNEFFRFKYTITGKSLMREFIEDYNSKGDVE